MTENQYDSYSRLKEEIGSLPDQGFGRFQRLLERRGRAAPAAPVHDVQQINTGVFVRMQSLELITRGNLAVSIQRFRTWGCYQRYDEALETGSVVRTGEVTRYVLEEMYGKYMVIA